MCVTSYRELSTFSRIHNYDQNIDSIKIIQRAWRSHFRRNLENRGVTFEAWRTNVAVKRLDTPIARALAIKQIYKSSHYVFTHGQSLYNSVVTIAINQLAQFFTPANSHPLNIQFRIPGSIPHTDNVQSFFNKHGKKFGDNTISAEILSVDAYFYNETAFESARYYYRSNCNVSSEIAEAPFLKLLPNSYLVGKFIKKLSEIRSDIRKESDQGALYAICVPKKSLNSPNTFGYASGPNGVPEDEDYLDDLQNDNANKGVHQYRLLTSRLSTEPGVRVFSFNNLTEEKNRKYKERIYSAVKEFRLMALLYKLDKIPNRSEMYEIMELSADLGPKLNKKAFNKIIVYKREFLPLELVIFLTKSICKKTN